MRGLVAIPAQSDFRRLDENVQETIDFLIGVDKRPPTSEKRGAKKHMEAVFASPALIRAHFNEGFGNRHRRHARVLRRRRRSEVTRSTQHQNR